ncbi:hypothetical protein GC175_25790 [bacterium]|nr:hypothetical protein [bacterium]
MRQDSYLLRFWRTAQGREWRITLIPIVPDTVEQHFVSVDDLFRRLYDAYQSTDTPTNEPTSNAVDAKSQL